MPSLQRAIQWRTEAPLQSAHPYIINYIYSREGRAKYAKAVQDYKKAQSRYLRFEGE